MSFQSTIFLTCFLPIAGILYNILPKCLRIYFLTGCSLIFLTFIEVLDLPFMIGVAFGAWILTSLIVRLRNKLPSVSRLLAISGILVMISMLVYYKYSAFIIYNLNRFIGLKITTPNIKVPIGISFFTFLIIAWIVDVYRNPKNHIRNPVDGINFVLFFPRVLSGPIQRVANYKSNILREKPWTDRTLQAMRRMTVGLAKKCILADTFGLMIQTINRNGHDYSFSISWLYVLLYALQIYYDFSGYSDMAIGIAGFFGYTLPENFNYPYAAGRLTDFWRRWHISLSTWFRDYIYIPLGGNRKRVYLNILIVFLVTGIWHGAAWTFILWGLSHGIFLIVEKYIHKIPITRTKVVRIIGHMITPVFVALTWVLFDASSFSAAKTMYLRLIGIGTNATFPASVSYILRGRFIFLLVVGIIGIFPIIPFLKQKLIARGQGMATAIEHMQAILTLILLILCFLFIVSSNYSPHIYFQF
ncbi:MAG: MBOAT family O-acyltransferase [Eubacteriales bacterium]|nr:MBOAT family O-acyltransferase [Eubacteriales bacterium]